MTEVRLPLVDEQGGVVATLEISLPLKSSRHPHALLVDDESTDLERVQLLEGSEYLYQLLDGSAAARLEPSELFEPDRSIDRGRLRTGLSVGRVRIEAVTSDGRRGAAAVEVRSRKLNYLEQYRWMLRDIADVAAEVIMERFASSEQAFQPDDSRDAQSVYQRFTFLRALLGTDEFDASFQRIITDPYVSWSEIIEPRRPSQGIRSSSAVAREFAKIGPRQEWPGGPIPSLPAVFRVARTEATEDNPPNQFVKFALTRWRDVVLEMLHTMRSHQDAPIIERGIREAQSMLDRLEIMLAEPLLREASELAHFPAANQVLQKRAGYRDIYRAYIQFEVAAKLSWPGGDDVYFAGQRNVATLYEYWTFLELAKTLAILCDEQLDLAELVAVGHGQMSVNLQQGASVRLEGKVHRLGRNISVEVYFNKSFGRHGSWTQPMRPDASVYLSCKNDPLATPVWLHFDAKYRIDSLAQVMGSSLGAAENEWLEDVEEAERPGKVKSEDLLKMHAYRDAIHRSAGAYVLYPGDELERKAEYQEVLPGLGAFPLKPTATGPAEGTSTLLTFLNEVITHVASQATQHERARFWQERAFSGAVPPLSPAVPYIDRPPADARVLLGFVRSREQLNWIHRTARYNVRAGDRTGAVPLSGDELGAGIVILFSNKLGLLEAFVVEGLPQIATKGDMKRLGYPHPRGALYFCLGLGPSVTLPPSLSVSTIERLRARLDPAASRSLRPLATTWLDVISTI